MASYCKAAAPGNEPVAAICEEMAHRFSLSERAMIAMGDGTGRTLQTAHILAAAITCADTEYRASLPVLVDAAWQPPRHQPRSFVRFLDDHGFVIPWYLANGHAVARIQQAIAGAHAACGIVPGSIQGSDLRTQRCVAEALADVWFRSSTQQGWHLRGDPDEHPERTVDRVIVDGRARCSEWTALEFATAVIAPFGMYAGLHRAAEEMHMEPYLALQSSQDSAAGGPAVLWRHPLYLDGASMATPRPLRATAVTTVPRSDIVVGIAINRAVTAEYPGETAYRAVESQLAFVQSSITHGWIHEVLGDLILDDNPCTASSHYAAVIRSSGATAAIEKKFYRALQQCPE